MQNSTEQINQTIDCRYYPSTKQLNLTYLNCNNTIWLNVLKSRDWSFIVKLSLECVHIGDKGLEDFLKLCWKQLETLNISQNSLTAEGVKLIMQKHFPKLHSLNLSYDKIGDEGLNHLIQVLGEALIQLKIRYCQIKYGISLSKLRNIQILHMFGNQAFSNSGVKLLIKNDFCFLEELCLGDCSIGDEGLKHITKAKWNNLSFIAFQYNKITNGWFFFSQNNWPKLSIFTNYTYKAIDVLQLLKMKPKSVQVFPNTVILNFQSQLINLILSRYGKESN